MISRASKIEAFLQAQGWGTAKRGHLAGDASARRYERLKNPDTGVTAVLMDAPPEQGENVDAFVSIGQMFSGLGLNTPSLIAQDCESGLLLLEDFGDALFAAVCTATPELEQEVYEAAVDALSLFQGAGTASELNPYTAEFYLSEAGIFAEWYVPAFCPSPQSQTERTEFDAIVSQLIGQIADRTDCVVHRDYHAENLFWLPDQAGNHRVGIIDFQGALAGHPAYDLLSLLEDARRDPDPKLRNALINRHLGFSGENEADFHRAFAIIGAQRNMKILGLFARLCQRDGKPGYLNLIPRVWNNLMVDLQHPALVTLKSVIAKHVPAPTAASIEEFRQKCL